MTETPVYLDESQQDTSMKDFRDVPQEERLYNYDAREKKLLTKVIKLMKPARHNQIWESIFFQEE